MILIQKPSDAPIVQQCMSIQLRLAGKHTGLSSLVLHALCTSHCAELSTFVFRGCFSSFSSIHPGKLPGYFSFRGAHPSHWSHLTSYTLLIPTDHTTAICPVAFPLLPSSVACMLPDLSTRSPVSSEGGMILSQAVESRASPQLFSAWCPHKGQTNVMIWGSRSRPKCELQHYHWGWL